MGDALRIQVSEGVRQIHAQKRLGEQEYTARQTIKVVQGRENQVQFDLRQEPTLVAVPLEVAPSGKLEPSGQFEIPGKNF
jgi:hypothetical protein